MLPLEIIDLILSQTDVCTQISCRMSCKRLSESKLEYNSEILQKIGVLKRWNLHRHYLSNGRFKTQFLNSIMGYEELYFDLENQLGLDTLASACVGGSVRIARVRWERL